MSEVDARAVSVTVEGEPDGWEPEPGFFGEMEPGGQTRIVASVPPSALPAVHGALVRVLSAPLGLLYRQKIDRKDPKPEGHPPRDFVTVHVASERVRAALEAYGAVVYGDARAEIWIRGNLGEQVILDQDGVMFCYPDDPVFRETLAASGVPERSVQTMADRDYVKHWFHASCDAHEAGLMRDLGLQEVPHRKR